MSRNIFLSAFLAILIAGCARVTETTSPTQVEQTPSQSITATQRPQADTATFVPQTTSTPKHNRLTICLSAVPTSLYLYDVMDLATESVLEAIYDGPIDHRSFGYQPVILEKLPSLADGDAVFKQVSVQIGDLVVDVQGEVVNLQPGILVFPSGCTRPECSIRYEGQDSLQMDQLVVTFRLLPELKWSDGQPLTAYDSEYSFDLAASPDTPYSNKFKIERTASYQTLDNLTIKWTGLPGFIDQTYFLNFWSPLPEHIWGKYPTQALSEEKESVYMPVGWGPYKIKSYSDKYIELVKNQYYFRANEGLPRFDSIIYRFTGGDVEMNIDSILSGECDIVDQGSMLYEESGKLLRLDAQGRLSAIYVPGMVWEHIDFAILPAENWQGFSASQAFRDSRLRRAISSCINRQKVVDELFFGQTVVLDTYLPPAHPLYNPNLPHDEFNVAVGSSLLNEIGWLDDDNNPATPRIYKGQSMDIAQGTPLEFNYLISAARDRQLIAQILAESLAQCGIKLNVESKPGEELYAPGPGGSIFGRQFDMVQFGSYIGDDPFCDLYLSEAIPGDPDALDQNGAPQHSNGWGEDPMHAQTLRLFDGDRYPYGWGAWNETGYSNPEYDQACKDAMAVLPGQDDYKEKHFKVQEIFYRDLPVIPLFVRPLVAATRYDMCGFILDPTDSAMWNIEEFDYGPGCK